MLVGGRAANEGSVLFGVDGLVHMAGLGIGVVDGRQPRAFEAVTGRVLTRPEVTGGFRPAAEMR